MTAQVDDATIQRLRSVAIRLARRMREESGSSTALTMSRHSALAAIAAVGPVRMTDLAHMERVSKSSITRIVGGLAEYHLVELIPDASDGRSTLVRIRPEGQRILGRSSERAEALLAQQIRSLSDAERALLLATIVLMERLASGGRKHHRASRRRAVSANGHDRPPADTSAPDF